MTRPKSQDISRRKVATAGAWAMPTMAVSAAAPASAASTPSQPPTDYTMCSLRTNSDTASTQVTAVNGQDVTITFATGNVDISSLNPDPTQIDSFALTALSPDLTLGANNLWPYLVGTGTSVTIEPSGVQTFNTPISFTYTSTFTLPDGYTASLGDACTSILDDTGTPAGITLDTRGDVTKVQAYQVDFYAQGSFVGTGYLQTQGQNDYSFHNSLSVFTSDCTSAYVNTRCGMVS